MASAKGGTPVASLAVATTSTSGTRASKSLLPAFLTPPLIRKRKHLHDAAFSTSLPPTSTASPVKSSTKSPGFLSFLKVSPFHFPPSLPPPSLILSCIDPCSCYLACLNVSKLEEVLQDSNDGVVSTLSVFFFLSSFLPVPISSLRSCRIVVCQDPAGSLITGSVHWFFYPPVGHDPAESSKLFFVFFF